MNPDALIEHEVSYYAFSSTCEKTPFGWFLDCDDLPLVVEVNRALRVRDDGRGPEATARALVARFNERGVDIAIDLDAVAEEQGIGSILRKLGIMPVFGSRRLMELGTLAAVPECHEIMVVEVDRKNGADVEAWVATNLHDI